MVSLATTFTVGHMTIAKATRALLIFKKAALM